MNRNQKIYFLFAVISILLGLLSRTRLTPALIYPYLGDYLYAVLFFCIIGFIFIKSSPLKVALISLFICYCIEFFQLYQADWLTTLKSYRLARLVLGNSFLWSDIISYTFGAMTGYILETLFYSKK
ncbi:MAG: DUF2809 domain-containing protein [Flexibacter sp. CG_4_10_14_3_um_filter_32_15]|nr:MAG: DUF2809 domain-containing protein [Flexibacter sp. CG_4_10_14_3_um_filter_32_15]